MATNHRTQKPIILSTTSYYCATSAISCLQTTPSANFQRTFCNLEWPSSSLFRFSGTFPTLLFADTELLPPIPSYNSAYYELNN